ncbi:hypothetical protein ACFQ35_05815 [Pseudochrobactrum kiredjianiae]|uniref:Uncharacterized protein n=2 Tax=Pseudochrobactrum kiredjianiae TaxID=386305 RepID=A0ABW3V200_9HYPH
MKLALEEECVHMENKWFFKWYHIGSHDGVVIDDFRGGAIRYAGLAYTGTPTIVYWQTISHYLQQKIGQLFNELEVSVQKYTSIETRRKALSESENLLCIFANKIRQKAVETDQRLRSNGVKFSVVQDRGRWSGTSSAAIARRIVTLVEIYCDQEDENLALGNLMTDTVSLVKADGTMIKENIKARVTRDMITTFDTKLPVAVGDHILRALNNGLVDDFVVLDPSFNSAAGTIKAHFQIKVRRSDHPANSPAQTIQQITQNFHGSHVRVYNDNAIDQSHNVTTINNTGIDLSQLQAFVAELKLNLQSLPEQPRIQIAESLVQLDREMSLGLPEPAKARSIVQSIKSIAENAAGGIISSGIVSMAASVLTGLPI